MPINHSERVRKQPVVLSLRIGPELAARLTTVAAVSGGTRSEVARTWLALMADVAERTSAARTHITEDGKNKP